MFNFSGLKPGRAVFFEVDKLAPCDRTLESLFNAACRALLEGAEPTEYTVVEEEMFYMPEDLDWTVINSVRREEYLPDVSAPEGPLACSLLWCDHVGVLLAEDGDRVLAACLPPPTVEQARFLSDCTGKLREMAASAREMFPPSRSPAQLLETAANRIDINKSDTVSPRKIL